MGEYKMKLDKMTFARVIAHCVSNGMSSGEYEVTELDNIIDISVEQERVYPCNAHIDDLMRLMVEGQRKIEAIKVHRAITGFGLKESKDAVEKYWVRKPNTEGATLGDILGKVNKS
jgi:hypothetical protein